MKGNTMDKIKRYIRYCICVYKILVAWVYVQLKKKTLYNMNIWLIQEKHTEARDNGYHLFKYLRKEHPDINAFFSITNDSVDHSKVDIYGNIIDADSIKHYIYYLAAKESIGSQAYGACPYPAFWVDKFRFLCRKDQRNIYLKHGIVKDKLPSLAQDKIRCDLFICASKRELEYVQKELGYDDKTAQLLGLCRYDNLINSKKSKNQILIMPTFRKYLVTKDVEHDATEIEYDVFKESLFYQSYMAILTNEEFLAKIRKNSYRIVFYLHYAFQAYTKLFSELNNDIITIADRHDYDVQQLLIDSSILITDYSSIYFDFAYMKKPEVFFQFDEQEYRDNHYKQGYFDYRIDGFGPVFTRVDETMNYVIDLIQNGCKMEKKYRDRVDRFFAYNDNCNCERNYKAIKGLN